MDDVRGVHEVYCLRRGDITFFELTVLCLVGRKGAISVRAMDPAHREREPIELLVQLTRRQGDGGVLSSLTSMAYKGGVTQCLRFGLDKMEEGR